MWEIYTFGLGQDIAPSTMFSLPQIWGPDLLPIKQQFARCIQPSNPAVGLRKEKNGTEESWDRFYQVL